MTDPLEREIEAHVEQLGFELVELERAGSRSRPILRLRIDREDSSPGKGVSLDDCSRVSRSVEAMLENVGRVPERYVLEVSSPGVERPLVRARDFERFVGKRISIVGSSALLGGAKRVEGELLGLDISSGQERIRLRTSDGIEVTIPREQTKRVHLVYHWVEQDDGN